jgi:hypothetical protein
VSGETEANPQHAEHRRRRWAEAYPMTKTYDGRPCCQAYGCNEAAVPFAWRVDFGSIEIEVYLCRRHERDVMNVPQLVGSKAHS